MLRFAILARVSTESQESGGVSLEVQTKTLTQCVERMNGVIIKEYVGQESAMGIKERPLFEEMLADCSKGLFDALCVYDLSRFSRNPEKSRYGLAILKKNNIRLFIQHTEYNLSNPETDLIVGIMNEVNHFTVNMQTQKSIASKLEIARRGWCVTRLPYGRRPKHSDKSRQCEWEVIPECQEQINKLYTLYVEQGLSLKEVGERVGMDESSVRKILVNNPGNSWTQTIKVDGHSEVITISIPPLLTPEQQEKVQHHARSNKQFNSRKNSYLLGGKIRCGVCGMSYVGMTSKNSYYNHSRHFQTDICIKNIRVELIEAAALGAISNLFSSTENLKKALENALGMSHQRKETIAQEIIECGKTLVRLKGEKDRLIRMVLKDVFNDDDISKEMNRIREDTLKNEELLKVLKTQLDSLSIEIPDDLHLRIQKYYTSLCGEDRASRNNEDVPSSSIMEWNQDSQQRLLDWFFGSSKKTGVEIKKIDGRVAFNIVGALGGELVGIIESNTAWSNIAGIETVNQTFNSTELVDFKRIIQDLDLLTRKGGCDYYRQHNC